MRPRRASARVSAAAPSSARRSSSLVSDRRRSARTVWVYDQLSAALPTEGWSSALDLARAIGVSYQDAYRALVLLARDGIAARYDDPTSGRVFWLRASAPVTADDV